MARSQCPSHSSYFHDQLQWINTKPRRPRLSERQCPRQTLSQTQTFQLVKLMWPRPSHPRPAMHSSWSYRCPHKRSLTGDKNPFAKSSQVGNRSRLFPSSRPRHCEPHNDSLHFDCVQSGRDLYSAHTSVIELVLRLPSSVAPDVAVDHHRLHFPFRPRFHIPQHVLHISSHPSHQIPPPLLCLNIYR